MFPILIPTETINRELDGQLLLGAHLVQRGARVFIGLDRALHTAVGHLQGGVVVGKAVEPFFPTADQSFYDHLRANDFSCVHLDDEGAFFPGREAEWPVALGRRLDMHYVAPDDVVAVWGRYQQAIYASQGGPQPIRVTGHPRFDLYTKRLSKYYAPLAEQLRGRYGDFVLVNTNLSRANNGLGIQASFSKRLLYVPEKPELRRDALRAWAHTSRILASFVELVHELSDAFPKLTIVLRPHPSESLEYYRTVTAGLPNVTVLHEGSVGPWIFATKAVIHDGCTTGMEAWLAGVPVITYKSFADDRYDQLLPNQLGARCTTHEEVIGMVQQVLAGRPPARVEAPTICKELLSNLERESLPLLLDAIELARPRIGSSRYRHSSHRLHAKLDGALEVLRARYRTVSAKRRKSNAYAHQKFYGFDHEDVADRMRRLEHATALRVHHEVLSKQLICLTPAT